MVFSDMFHIFYLNTRIYFPFCDSLFYHYVKKRLPTTIFWKMLANEFFMLFLSNLVNIISSQNRLSTFYFPQYSAVDFVVWKLYVP